MSETASKRIVDGLIRKDARVRKSGFTKAVSALSDSSYFAAAAKGIVPDAYLLDHDERVVVMYEVVDTHPIRPKKADRIAELSDELDDIYWTLRVIVLDYTGHTVCDVPGWAFLAGYTQLFASPNALDMTPAAMAVARAED
jgi:hypothetical protein